MTPQTVNSLDIVADEVKNLLTYLRKQNFSLINPEDHGTRFKIVCKDNHAYLRSYDSSCLSRIARIPEKLEDFHAMTTYLTTGLYHIFTPNCDYALDDKEIQAGMILKSDEEESEDE